jgi:hypothetical protein
VPDPAAWTFTAGGEISERLDWLTDVLIAPTGPEQRRRLRPSPRIVLSFDGLESGATRREMETLLVANGAGEWYAPLPHDASELATALTSGAVLDVDTTGRRFVAGGHALLIGDDARAYELGLIDSLTDSTVTLHVAPADTWPIGTRVVPMVKARLDAMPVLQRFTGDSVPLTLAFRFIEPLDWAEDAGDASYRDLPVMEWTHDWSTDPAFTPSRGLAIVDNDTSIPTVYDQAGIPLSQETRQYTLQGRDQIGAFRSLLYALGGRWSPLWLPTLAQDFLVTAPLASADTTLDVEWCGFAAWPLLPNRRDIRIELTDGTVIYRRITDADALGDDQERLTLDSALGVDATAAQVRLVSFMALVRQDTDVNLFRYWTSEVVLTEMSFRGFRDDDV